MTEDPKTRSRTSGDVLGLAAIDLSKRRYSEFEGRSDSTVAKETHREGLHILIILRNLFFCFRFNNS
jgi:hypothetical protein